MYEHNQPTAWRDIIGYYPEWMKNYSISANDAFDKTIAEFDRLVDDRSELPADEEQAILMEIANYHDGSGGLVEGEVLHVKGRGMYYAERSDTLDFIDGTAGISGYFGGFQLSSLPLYHELVYKRRQLYRPMLCIALEGYLLHETIHAPGAAIDDTAIVPIIGQDLCVSLRYDSYAC